MHKKKHSYICNEFFSYKLNGAVIVQISAMQIYRNIFIQQHIYIVDMNYIDTVHWNIYIYSLCKEYTILVLA